MHSPGFSDKARVPIPQADLPSRFHGVDVPLPSAPPTACLT